VMGQFFPPQAVSIPLSTITSIGMRTADRIRTLAKCGELHG
jgi:hypothetical protein